MGIFLGFCLLQLPLLVFLLAWAGERWLGNYRSPRKRTAGAVGEFSDPKVWLYLACGLLSIQCKRRPIRGWIWTSSFLGWLLALWSLLK